MRWMGGSSDTARLASEIAQDLWTRTRRGWGECGREELRMMLVICKGEKTGSMFR